MSMHSILGASLQVLGDGVSNSISVALATCPLDFPGRSLPIEFSLASNLPSSIDFVTSNSGQAVTVSYALGLATFTYTTPLANNAFDTIRMILKF